MIRRFQPLFVAFLILLNLSLRANAQNKDPIDLARDFPPELIRLDEALPQMEWQLKQLRATVEEQEKRLREIDARTAILNDQVNVLNQQLPIELRFADDDVRSKLVGDVLRELLAGRLEVASQEEAIAQFTSALEQSDNNLTKVDELRKRQYQINIEVTHQKLAAAKSSYDRAVQLAQKAFISQEEVAQEKYALKLAEMELQHAELDYELQQSSRKDEIANRLVEARISLHPSKARVAAAEQFLKLFSDSQGKFDSIAELGRKIASLNENRQYTEREIWSTQSKISELATLLSLTKSAAKAVPEDEKPNEKE